MRTTLKTLVMTVGVVTLCFAISYVVFAAIDSENTVRAATAAKLRRLEQHCVYERFNLEAIDHDLQSTSSNVMNDEAKQQFQLLAVDDFRTVKLCMPEAAVINPGDRALLCSKLFRNDTPCMLTIVKLARFYIR